MSGFIEGDNRYQSTLFPKRVDDYVEEDSVVRVSDVFIARLDISGLGFRTEAADTGCPGYHARTMLKIYVYGYLNQVHSSRRLEREAKRNVELMWLTGRLAPDQQLSLTGPDARSMKSRGQGVVGYNVQTAVDVDTHLVVAHEITNIGIDRRQLSPMANKAKEVLDADEPIKVIADQGYYRGEELLACKEVNITAYVAKSDTSAKRRKGEFSRRQFRHIAKDDEYECPAGERAIYRFTRNEAGKQIRRYWPSARVRCPIKSRCTPSDYRRISRWQHEAVVERAESRLTDYPEAMRIRRATVEHPFGTLKQWMGSTFLTRTIENVGTEMSLHVLAYNMKRAINLVGTKKLIEAI